MLARAGLRRAAPLRQAVAAARCASSGSPVPPPTASPPPRQQRGGLVRALALGLFGASAYALGSIYPPSLVSLLYPQPAPPRLAADSPEGKAHTQRIEKELLALPEVAQLRSLASPATGASALTHSGKSVASIAPGANAVTTPPATSANPQSTSHYLASRPYARFPPQKAMHSLTAGALRGPGLFAVPPLVLSLTPHGAAATGGSEGDAAAFLHLGRSMCGHDGLIHGGLLGTVMDETLARTAFYALPSRVGVTARLELDYRAPVKADQFVVVRTRRIEAKGRKAIVEGTMETLDGKVLVNAKAIFVEPKFAKLLDTSLVAKIMDTEGEAAK
jgi:acyl-coenzyme A thioesterase PaaI-like protein